MNDSLVDITVDQSLAKVTINREQKMNALSRATLDAIGAAFDDLAVRSELRCVLLSGAGERFFAAGGDVVELTAVKTAEQINAMADHARGVLDKIRSCAAPVIALMNGDALGGGAELATSCDFRIMRSGSHIGYIQGRLAINSAWGGGADLNALVGPARSLRMMARGELIEAQTALDWGLADAVAEAREMQSTIDAFIKPILRLSKASLDAFIAQSRAHRSGPTYQHRRELERQSLLKSWPQEEHWQAVEKFLARKQS